MLDRELHGKLHSKNSGERMLAVMQLGETAERAGEAFEQLTAALQDENVGVRTTAAGALVRVGARAVPHLEKQLHDAHALVRVNAACNLLRLQSHPAALNTVMDALRPDRDEKTKRNAFYDLANMGPAAVSALPAIVQALDDPAHAVRERAFDVLQILGHLAGPAVPKLLELWRKKQDRAEVVFTLGCMGPAAAAAVPVLIEALELPAAKGKRPRADDAPEDNPTELQERAATALGDVGPEARAAVPHLVKALTDGKGEVPYRAAESLTKLGPPVEGAGPGLLKLLKHKSFDARLTAARALATLAPDQAKKALPVLARDYKKHEYDRDEIAEVVMMIDPRAAEELTE